MAINFCTIASSTVDAFCGAQRAKVLARLIAIARPVVPPTTIIGGGVSKIEHPPAWNEPRVDLPPLEFEQPYITVVVRDLLGSNPSSQTLQASSTLELVLAYNLDFSATCDLQAGSVTVNITGLEV